MCKCKKLCAPVRGFEGWCCVPGATRGLAAQVAIALALPLAVAKGPDAEALAAAA